MEEGWKKGSDPARGVVGVQVEVRFLQKLVEEIKLSSVLMNMLIGNKTAWYMEKHFWQKKDNINQGSQDVA